MARPRAFDTDTAIGRAMHVFWTQGYEGASLTDLIAGMGIARGSLYKAFDDKKSLFIMVLQYYEQEVIVPAVEFLTDPNGEDGWERVKTVLKSVVKDVRAGDRRGCLVCSAVAGQAFADPDIAKAIIAGLEKVRNAIETALSMSAAHAHLEPKDLRGIADALMAQYIGLKILARSNATIASLERSIAALEHLSGQVSKTRT